MDAGAENIVLLGILTGAAIQDVRTGRISNRLILFGLAAGLVYQVTCRGLRGVGNYLILCFIPVILLLSFFHIRALGAGDIKLFSMIGSFLTIRDLCGWMILSFLAAALISLGVLVRNGIFLERIQSLIQYVKQWVEGILCYRVYPNPQVKNPHVIHFTVPMLLGFIGQLVLKKEGLY